MIVRRRRWAVMLATTLIAASLACGGQTTTEVRFCSVTTEHVGNTCAVVYALCSGGTDRFQCEDIASAGVPRGDSGGVTCRCFESGVLTGRGFGFTGEAFCTGANVSSDDFKKSAVDTCGWNLVAN